MRVIALAAGLTLVAALTSIRPIAAQTDVLTYRYDNARSGIDLKETILNKSNVKSGQFGKLAFRNVDGNIYAQPLIVFQAGIGNPPKPANVVIVATEHNSVYAFDADDTSAENDHPSEITKKALWHRGPDANPDGSPGLGSQIESDGMFLKDRITMSGDNPDAGCFTMADGKCFVVCTDLTTEVGITSTPVIKITNSASPKQGVIFVVSKSFQGNKVTYTLFALNLADGRLLGQGVRISGTVSGPNGTITFDPLIQLNRPALLLDHDVLYVAFGSHCDSENYRGWIFAYDVSDPSAPQRLSVLSTTFTNRTSADANGRGGIWMSGYGPATDGNGIYFSTGDGTYNVTNMSFPELADSVVKVKLGSGKMEIQDWFSPQNRDELMKFDADLGSAGPVLVPDSHLLIAAGKEGRMYLIDRNDMGRGTKPSLQSFQVTPSPLDKRLPANPQRLGDMTYWNIHGAPVVWPVSGRQFVYVMGEEDHLRQYTLVPDPGSAGWKFDNPLNPQISKATMGLPAGLSSTPPEYSDLRSPKRASNSIFMPGGFLTVSANGTDSNTGIVWATMPFCDDANSRVVWGILRAFDASDISRPELWDSEGPAQCKDGLGGSNDSVGFFAKYNPPLVANGKVYVAAFQQEDEPDRMQHRRVKSGLLPALVIYGLKQNK